MSNVKPLIASELEQMLPLPDGRRADWGDVLRRAGAEGVGRVWHPGPAPTGRPRWRPVLVAAVVVAALVGVGVAIAAGFGAFNGISAAQHPQTGADVLDPQTAARLQQTCSSNVPDLGYRPNCHLVLGSARLVDQLPSGRKVYVITDTHGDLCVLLPAAMMSCGSALTQSRPTTTASFQASLDQQPIVYGVALDDVTAVSFDVAGRKVSVTVKDNVWAYEGASLPEARSLTAHFEDGRTVTLNP
jgi:hypothetical protein